MAGIAEKSFRGQFYSATFQPTSNFAEAWTIERGWGRQICLPQKKAHLLASDGSVSAASHLSASSLHVTQESLG